MNQAITRLCYPPFNTELWEQMETVGIGIAKDKDGFLVCVASYDSPMIV